MTQRLNERHTQDGAIHTAAQIREYWAKKGYLVVTTICPIPGRDRLWGIRSDLINGLPQQSNKLED